MSLTILGGESEILGGESFPPNSPRINTTVRIALLRAIHTVTKGRHADAVGMCVHIDPLLWHTSSGCVRACGKYDGCVTKFGHVSPRTHHACTSFLCCGLLAVGCVLTYYS